MKEYGSEYRRGEILRALLNGQKWKNELVRLLVKVMARKTLLTELISLQTDGLITISKTHKKDLISLTENGKDECARQRIAREVGYSGVEWANQYLGRGYRVRFLSDLTGLDGHNKWLFAWNPITKDADLAAVFGVRSVKSKQGGPRYFAQLIDRNKNPNYPLKSAELFSFIDEKCNDWSEAGVSKILKAYWDPNNFNSYTCVLLPKEEISFGFPKELGSFDSLMFIGFDHQKQFPMIPKMDLWMGGFDLSNNLRVVISYDLNLTALYSFSWLIAKEVIDPDSFDKEQMKLWKQKTWLGSFNPNINLVCKNEEKNKICNKMGIKCLAATNNGLDFKKCPILIDEVKEVHTINP